MIRKLWILSENKKRQLNIRSIIYLVYLKISKYREKKYITCILFIIYNFTWEIKFL